MANFVLDSRQLATRPDRIDFRDREYTSRLISLPDCFPDERIIGDFLKRYCQTDKRILNQGTEGACTGYGLAAVINYIIWDRWMRSHKGNPGDTPAPALVSERMLYDTARLYDEWEGEAYSGSSCRGAMKGWHKHGVCELGRWPRDPDFEAGNEDAWGADALSRPLGAYYRVNARSIADMQAAIHEVRAVYCSSRVHGGWQKDKLIKSVKISKFDLPVIDKTGEDLAGGHAFALVGYTQDGFIVQNSWGPGWGKFGFALLPYEDWIEHGNDAWVAAMSAPMNQKALQSSPSAMSKLPLVETALSNSALRSTSLANGRRHWSPDDAYQHSVVMGNDGKILRRLINASSAQETMHQVMIAGPKRAIANGVKHIMIYAHGGLNSEQTAVNRTMLLGPWFEANGIYPIFVNWRTSFLESIQNIGLDITKQFMERNQKLSEGIIGDLLDDAKKKLQSQFDKAFEATAEKVIGKPVWSQMKQNARAAADLDGGTRQILNHLRMLKEDHPDLSIHLVGHSAGAILLGNMLSDLKDGDKLDSIHLFAPACTTRFAVARYGRILKQGILDDKRFFIENLNDDLERKDSVGPYGKSLLYLVSRALEDVRNAPLLGLQKAWLLDAAGNPRNPDTIKLSDLKHPDKSDLKFMFDEDHIKYIRDWNALAHKHRVQIEHHHEPQAIAREVGTEITKIERDHGSFDNNIRVMDATLYRILRAAKLENPITDLTGF